MYIVKNALKCISRSKGRNILIGIIVLIIATSACVGLSIRQAAESTKEEALESMSVTGTISFDRNAMMEEMKPPESGTSSGEEFDKSDFQEKMQEQSSLSLAEYKKYATASTVKDFYYTMSASLNGTKKFQPVSTSSTSSSQSSNSSSSTSSKSSSSSTSSTSSQQQNGMPQGGMGGGGQERMMGMQSDFSIEGVSGENAMTDFIDGTSSITSGTVFEEGTKNYECIISEELATYNNISVGDTVKFENPNNEDETYEFTVVGIYNNSSSNEDSFSMMGSTSTDPANKIYTSYNALKKLTKASASVAKTTTDSNTGMKFKTTISGTVDATYTFADSDAYYQFETEVREMGLDDSYTVSSPDITSLENSLVPLDTLGTTAGYFLIIILAIGAIVLIVLNIFNIRERKYEIGVLTAMGMKKGKVALQFLCEIFMVTLLSVVIGIGAGAVSSVPITNALLANQVTSQTTSQNKIEENFGRPGNSDSQSGGGEGMQKPDGDSFGAKATNYVTEINNSVNLTVVLEMLGIAILLTLVAGAVSVLFVMRYEPLKILSNRD